MANAILAYDDCVDRGTVTANSEQFNLPAINLQSQQLSPRVWRSNAVTSATLNVDFGTDRAIDVVALLRANLTSAGTWRVRLDSDSGFTAPHIYDSGSIASGIDPDFRAMIHVLPTQATARYLRIDLSDASASYLEAARLFAAGAWRMTRNFAFGLTEKWADATQQARSEGGQVWLDRGAVWREWTFDLPAVTTDEKRTHVARLGRLARARDVLLITDPTSTNLGRDSIFGLLEQSPASRWSRFAWHELPLTIVERL